MLKQAGRGVVQEKEALVTEYVPAKCSQPMPVQVIAVWSPMFLATTLLRAATGVVRAARRPLVTGLDT
jgi:hypothetical protein